MKNSKPIFWLSGGHLVNDIYTGILNPIMPFIAAKIGISMAVATVILTISHIFSSLLQPVFGYFADSIAKRGFIFWGLLLASIFIPLSAKMTNVGLLVLCIALGSIGSSFFHPQALGFTSKFAEGSAKIMAVFLAMGTLGYSLGPVISSAITQIYGTDTMPYMSIIGVVWAFLMFALVPKVSLKFENSKMDFKKTFVRILTNKKLIILNIVAMLKTMVLSSCFILLPFLWKDLGYKPLYIGKALFMFIFAGGIASLVSAYVEKLIGTANVFYISMISTLPLMIIFVLTYKTFPHFALAIFVITGFVTMLATPIIMVMAQNVLPEYKSIISGFINGFSWGIIAVVMSLLGFVAENIGITKVLIFVALIPAICSLLVKELFKD